MSRPGKPMGNLPAYRFALLAPTKKAVEQSGVLGPQTLGIEVTVPVLAAGCALGNIDPQHTAGEDGRAAIEAALAWPLPAPGSILATVRPDLDSVGAMVVLTMRAEATTIGCAARARIDEIARA